MAGQDMDAQWEEYKAKFNKVYEPEEDKMRRDLWETTLQKIETHNKEADEGKHTWWMGINQFTDKVKKGTKLRGQTKCVVGDSVSVIVQTKERTVVIELRETAARSLL